MRLVFMYMCVNAIAILMALAIILLRFEPQF